MSGSIVVGYTATDAGADALALGARLARSLGADLDLIIVLPPEGTRSAALVPPGRAFEEHVRAHTLLSMGHYGALPEPFARVSPRFFTPGFATIASAVVASAFYGVMRVVSEDTLWDTILTLGMMICFYYGITAFACVWYFRRQWFDSARNVFFTFLFPLVGGIILAVLFVTTLIDSMDPAYGSGTEIGGLGIVFVLGIGIIGIGIVIMIWQAVRRPAFFRGETLGTDAPPSIRRR